MQYRVTSNDAIYTTAHEIYYSIEIHHAHLVSYDRHMTDTYNSFNSSRTQTKLGTVCKPCECQVNQVNVVFNCLDRTRPLNNRIKIVWNRDKPCLTEYIRALFVHTRATFESNSYQLIRRHGLSPILVPVIPCINEYAVWKPYAQPCFVGDRM